MNDREKAIEKLEEALYDYYIRTEYLDSIKFAISDMKKLNEMERGEND